MRTAVVKWKNAPLRFCFGGAAGADHYRRRVEDEVTFGHVVEAPAARFHKMNEEHVRGMRLSLDEYRGAPLPLPHGRGSDWCT